MPQVECLLPHSAAVLYPTQAFWGRCTGIAKLISKPTHRLILKPNYFCGSTCNAYRCSPTWLHPCLVDGARELAKPQEPAKSRVILESCANTSDAALSAEVSGKLTASNHQEDLERPRFVFFSGAAKVRFVRNSVIWPQISLHRARRSAFPTALQHISTASIAKLIC